ncbi:MAG: transposase [Pseudomonadota bacterium]
MPRRARLILPNVPMHLIQRGNNKQACFLATSDYTYYLHWLSQYAPNTGCQIHAYVLMTNHVHLLMSALTATSAAQMMKALGQRYAQYINRTYGRSGTLWEGRYRSCPTQHEAYVLACYRYIELNPVRSRMVDHPADYRWSSYRANAHGEASPFVQSHPVYDALAAEQSARQAAYRALFQSELQTGLIEQIRRATNGNRVLGDHRFAAQVEASLGRRAAEGIPGRPRALAKRGTE